MVMEKTKLAVNALGRIMPNIGGHSQTKRRILMLVANSWLFYIFSTWAESGIKMAYNQATLVRPQRQVALRIRCYRIVSDIVALMLAGTPLVNLHAMKGRKCERYFEECTTYRKEGY